MALCICSGVFCHITAYLCMTEISVSLTKLFRKPEAVLLPLGSSSPIYTVKPVSTEVKSKKIGYEVVPIFFLKER